MIKIHPDHYKKIPVECIDVVRHFNFNLGNAIKYIWRCEHHKDGKMTNLAKAMYYIQDEMNKHNKDCMDAKFPGDSEE